MNRRDMLKAAGMFSAMPFLLPGTFPLPAGSSESHQDTAALKRFGDGRDWFFEKRYGMFIHWGIYSIPAWHEQHQWRARVPRAEYVKLADQWNPKKFNPEKWLDIMEAAGMKYITVRSYLIPANPLTAWLTSVPVTTLNRSNTSDFVICRLNGWQILLWW